MLTTEQQALRKNRITGSRVAKLVTGSEADILTLWEIMTGRREEDDLSNVWPVYLGSHTEDLHLNWLERVWGEPITRRGEFAQSAEHEWAGVTLDGWRGGCPVEVKHVGGWEERAIASSQRYYPQCQWQAYCCEAPGTSTSAIIEGAREPFVTYLPRDDEHIADLVDRAGCIHGVRRTADYVQPIAGSPVTVTLPSQWRTVDLATDTPNWGGEMQTALDEWQATVAEAKRNEDAKASVKKLLPEDVGLVIAGGIQVKRAKNGAVSIRGT
jgi:hypothetical protein